MPRSTLQPLSMEQLRHPDARWLVAYSQSKTAPGELLARDTILPHETHSMAPHLMMLEPTEKPEELRYQAVGEAITARFGIDLTGKTLPLTTAGGWAPAMLQALHERRPIALIGEVPGGQASWARLEALIMPVAFAGGGMGILAGLFFLQA
jgi:hypothetical protein